MSARINLLPDLRQAKLAETRRRQLATGLSTIICLVAVGGTVALFIISQVQHLRINQLTSQIAEKKSEFKNIPDIQTILTLQENLAAIPGQYNNRLMVTHFINDFNQVDNKDISLGDVDLGSDGTLEIKGRGKTAAVIHRLDEALEADNVTIGSNPNQHNQPFFQSVDVSTENVDGSTVQFTLSANVSSEVLHANQ